MSEAQSDPPVGSWIRQQLAIMMEEEALEKGMSLNEYKEEVLTRSARLDTLMFGTFKDPVRCDTRVASNNMRCTEVAFWLLRTGAAPKFVCDRCLHESIRRLTANDQYVSVSRIPRTHREPLV